MATQVSTDRSSRGTDRREGPRPPQAWTVAATNDRLVGECLDELMAQLAASEGRLPAASIARLARLVTAVSALRDVHSVDAAGRCLECSPHWWSRRGHTCDVHQALDDFVAYEPSVLSRA